MIEIICLLILVIFIGFQLKYNEAPGPFLRRLFWMGVAAWIGENTVIHAYHFYSYSPHWSLFVDQVPLMILLIWPVVIYSAWNLVGYLLSASPWKIALAGAAIVLADASLIEPIAVAAKLWKWHEPGIFEVPPIGILGWSFFAFGCILLLEWNKGADKKWYWDGLVLILPPLVTHFLLLASWWGFFRWVNETLPSWPVVGMFWGLAILLAFWAWREKASAKVPLLEMVLRIPGAVFFFVLLALYGRECIPLIAYALAFSPPYLVVTFGRRSDIEERLEACPAKS